MSGVTELNDAVALRAKLVLSKPVTSSAAEIIVDVNQENTHSHKMAYISSIKNDIVISLEHLRQDS